LATVECFFALDHPAAQGHFPGNPIIPGAVLLSEALKAIETNLGVILSPCRIKAAKFFYPTRPGDHVRIEFTGLAPDEIKIACSVEGKTVLTGVVKCGALRTTA
jgi:3-hydroxyacyl-[acyl-carrier-protein] dehydratase